MYEMLVEHRMTRLQIVVQRALGLNEAKAYKEHIVGVSNTEKFRMKGKV